MLLLYDYSIQKSRYSTGKVSEEANISIESYADIEPN